MKNQNLSIANMWAKGVIKTALVLWLSAVCCSLPVSVCFAQTGALPSTFKQMDLDGSARHATERGARLEGLLLRPIQRRIHRLLYDGQQRRELWRGHDDLCQLVRHGHCQTVSVASRWLFAYAVLFRPEEYLGSIIPVGCPVYDLDRSHQPEWLVGATNSLRRIRRRHYGDLRQHERLLVLHE